MKCPECGGEMQKGRLYIEGEKPFPLPYKVEVCLKCEVIGAATRRR